MHQLEVADFYPSDGFLRADRIKAVARVTKQRPPHRHAGALEHVILARPNSGELNLFLAFVYNAVGVPVAAGILYPFTGVLISPIWASAAMTLSSVSVIGNALRLRRAAL